MVLLALVSGADAFANDEACDTRAWNTNVVNSPDGEQHTCGHLLETVLTHNAGHSTYEDVKHCIANAFPECEFMNKCGPAVCWPSGTATAPWCGGHRCCYGCFPLGFMGTCMGPEKNAPGASGGSLSPIALLGAGIWKLASSHPDNTCPASDVNESTGGGAPCGGKSPTEWRGYDGVADGGGAISQGHDVGPCGDCAAIVQVRYYGGTCNAFCQLQGLACENAWDDEDDESCSMSARRLGCDHEFVDTSDGICRCR